jgi:hypothetical protein
VSPALGPPLAPQIAGANAFAAASGVGQTPLIAWTAPAIGTPTFYRLVVNKLGTDGSVVPVATIFTKNTFVRVPPGVLVSGSFYALQLSAVSSNGLDPTQTPFQSNGTTQSEATLVSAMFSP